MLRTVPPSFAIDFTRSGGALVTARVDIWQAAGDDWNQVAACVFGDVTAPSESLPVNLAPGNYAGIFKCYVEESLNGKYAFSLSVNGLATYSGAGDVNTTAAQDDNVFYKDQFSLVVVQTGEAI